jgi:hypothetical protein
MDVSDFAPDVSSSRDEVAFQLSGRMRVAACVITRQALEDHFWLPPGGTHIACSKTFLMARSASRRSRKGNR